MMDINIHINGAVSASVADEDERFALSGLTRGARVYQADNKFWYELVNPALPDLAASWQSIPKRYKALMGNVSGEATPTVAFLEKNELGSSGVWTRAGAGHYRVTFAPGTFTRMPYVKFSHIVQNDLSAFTYIYPDSNFLPDAIEIYTGLYQLDENGDFRGAHADGMFDNQWIEIEVSP